MEQPTTTNHEETNNKNETEENNPFAVTAPKKQYSITTSLLAEDDVDNDGFV
jgi:hypothetical protein